MSRVSRKRRTIGLREDWRNLINDHVIDLCWSPRKKKIAAAAVSGPITIFNAETGDIDHILEGHGFGTMTIAWHPDEDILATAGQDGKAKLWSSELGDLITELGCGAAWVEHISWSKDSAQDRILATGAGKKLKFWSANGDLIGEALDQPNTIADIQWNPRENILASISYGGIKLWSPGVEKELRVFDWQGSALKIDWSPDTRFIATGDQDSTVRFWFMETGQDLQMSGYPTKIRELSWDKSSRYLATGGGSQVVIWDCSGKGPEGRRPIMLDEHEDFLVDIAFQHHGDLLASAGLDGLLAIWEPVTGRKRKQPKVKIDFDNSLTKVAWSLDDTKISVGDDSGVIAVFTLE
ncbi:TPA: WD40 repeat domain-containing protein [Candidatus Poribacteria bacterium]|nr:WD40 repeat domain-containing protein [Candidatus Poribacteria bacterium]HIA69021.1 WD40 repeat domain-containing protein [Candidatus Poribacteria bacterium]HIB87454.1 WD40 repeat domain-containing protein [Candidatus Poribacteria bacterium]HIB99801.1 WD40 repeat domain-containing protein [Candidatus Poribacteria bacterium]HIC16693.1 WD40 repeat domain-containing protein [Candidatus Poribacteria bacterium]